MNQVNTITNITSSIIYKDLSLIRSNKPIVHSLTNFVAMNVNANILLALGASPIMAHAKAELDEIVNIANALVINIGTLDESWLQSIEIAQNIANKNNTPIIFDPVGSGASGYRTNASKKVLDCGINIIRGNSSEIMSLVDSNITTKGVDSQHNSLQAIDAAKHIAKTHDCTVVVSGQTDLIVDSKNVIKVNNGSDLFTRVTAMGCSATAIIGAFAAINRNYTLAAANAVLSFNIAGEIAAQKASGPAIFLLQLQDMLYSLKEADLDILNIQQEI